MIKFARFHEVVLEIYWDDGLIGRVKIAANHASSLAGGTGNLTLSVGEHFAQKDPTDSGHDTTQPKTVVVNVTESDLAPLISSPLNAPTTLSIPPAIAIRFETIAGARRVGRNDVFLTFYLAVLHTAQFSTENLMDSFQSNSPSGKLHLHMDAVGIGCPVSKSRAAGGSFS